MKLSLIAAVNVMNYGTMLQSYALQKVLINAGYLTKIINYTHKGFLKQAVRIFNIALVSKKWKSVRKNQIIKKFSGLKSYNEKKNDAFEAFMDESFTFTEKITSRDALIQQVKDMDAVVLGSDQVWNPVNLGKDYYTMTFVPDSVKKVAYAPSFGVHSIPYSQIGRTKRYLKRIEYISVREKSGAQIVEKLTGRNVPVVCDPTLLLTSEEWVHEERFVADIPERYIFCYFLGDSHANREFANHIKMKTNCAIVHLPYMDEFVKNDQDFGDIVPEGIGPREFLYLIHHADYVCTDSFHGTVFSLQFHKNFYSMPRTEEEGRGSTSGRITNLLSMVGLSERFIREPKEIAVEMSFDSRGIDWKHVDRRIEAERKISEKYLFEALGS